MAKKQEKDARSSNPANPTTPPRLPRTADPQVPCEQEGPTFSFIEEIKSFKEFLVWGKISRTTAYDQIGKGLLCPIYCGKKLLFPHSVCIAWLNKLSEIKK